jgi:hypothetical protein
MDDFKSVLRILGHLCKTFWWVIVLILVAVLFGWLYLVNRKKRGQIENMVNDVEPSLVFSVAAKVGEAVTDIKVERAVIGAETIGKRAKLEAIRKEPDGKKRRERLAEVLQGSL